MSRSQHRRGLVKSILFSAAFIGYIVPIVIPLFMRDMARDLGIGVAPIGLLAGVQSLIIGLASLVLGPLSDRFGRKMVLGCSLMLNGLAIVAFSRAWDLWSLYVLGMISAVTFGPLVFCALAYVGDHFAPEERSAAVGVVAASIWGAVIAGTPLAVLLMEMPRWGWRFAFFCIGALSFAVGLSAWLGLEHIPAARKEIGGVAAVAGRYLSFVRTAHLRGFLAIFFLMRMGVGMYLVYNAAYFLIGRSFPAEGFLAIYPIAGILAFIASVLAGKFLDRLGARPVIFYGNLLIIASVLLVIYFPTTPDDIVLVVGVLSTLYMVSEALRLAALQAEAVSKVAIEARGAFLGATSFLMYVGYASGALAGGLVLRAFGGMGSPADDIRLGYAVIIHATAFVWLLAMALGLYYTQGSTRTAVA